MARNILVISGGTEGRRGSDLTNLIVGVPFGPPFEFDKGTSIA